MGVSLLVEYYNAMPEREPGEDQQEWAARLKSGIETFRKQVGERYNEGTLQRLLDSTNTRARRAAVLALGLTGTMRSNRPVAGLLRDDDRLVRQMAADALWSIWFRGDAEAHCRELQRLIRLDDPQKTLAGLDRLIKKAPSFAEAYNQRAILYFRQDEFQKSIADCERVIELNPCHFGAQAGLAQCYMKLKKPRAALKAFRSALRINPNMDSVRETVRALEDVLGGEDRNK